MVKTRKALVLVLAAATLLPAGAARAHTELVMIDDLTFAPEVVGVLTTNPNDPAREHPLRWRNDDGVDHRIIEDPDQEGITLRTATLDPGETSGPRYLTFAATWRYVCAIHPSMEGRARVRPALYEPGNPGDYAVTNGPNGTAILRLGNADLPDAWVMDVQRRRGAGDWVLIREGVTRRTIELSPNAEGVYRFRTRIMHTSSGGYTNWSPASKTLTVT